MEFADYRNYTPGDDLRRVDWNAYARLERLFLKLFQEEEDLTVHVLLDASSSMDWGDSGPVFGLGTVAAPGGGTPASADQNKLIYAKRTAAALGYIALAGFDRVTVAAFHRRAMQRFAPVRGQGPRRHPAALYRRDRRRAARPTWMPRCAPTPPTRATPASASSVSDFFTAQGGTEGLAALQAGGHEIQVLHILAPAEVHPELALLGDLRLRDSETGADAGGHHRQRPARPLRREVRRLAGRAGKLLPPPGHQLPPGHDRRSPSTNWCCTTCAAAE